MENVEPEPITNLAFGLHYYYLEALPHIRQSWFGARVGEVRISRLIWRSLHPKVAHYSAYVN
jgi:hypothetical protein